MLYSIQAQCLTILLHNMPQACPMTLLALYHGRTKNLTMSTIFLSKYDTCDHVVAIPMLSSSSSDITMYLCIS